MTIQKVTVSGKSFKRPNHNDYLFVGTDGTIRWEKDFERAVFTMDSLNATDWSVKIEKSAKSKKRLKIKKHS